MTDDPSTLRERIEHMAYQRPTATYSEIAEALDTSNTWVGEVINDSPEIKEVRDGFDGGVEVPATTGTGYLVADALESLYPSLAKRLREAVEDDEIDRIEIKLHSDDD